MPPAQNLRSYGAPPVRAVLLHGGPGAPGEMAPVAREISKTMGVLEPLQTARDLEGQVLELKDVLLKHAGRQVTLVGWSWGAFLGFIFTALNPTMVKKLVLVSAPAFEDQYAQDMVQTRLDRLKGEDLAQAIRLMGELNDPAVEDKDRAFAELGRLIEKADSFEPIPHESEMLGASYETYKQVWTEAAELRTSQDLLHLGPLIACPVVAIHGDYDPHLAEGVRGPLSRELRDFKFVLLEKCGHQPWNERRARERFFAVLGEEIA